MNSTVITVLPLPHSTADCDEGPKFEYAPGVVTLSYDYEDDTGVSWAMLKFDGAIAITLTPSICVTEFMLSAYSKVCENSESEWIKQLTLKARENGMAFPIDRRHFFVYFDHVGCVEVLATDVELMKE